MSNSKAILAMNAMWTFAGQLVEKHGMEGTDILTDDEHAEWQTAAGLCHAALREEEAAKTAPDPRIVQLAQLQGAVGALYDELERTGLLDGDNSLRQYLVYRLRREAAAASGYPDAAQQAAYWQGKIDELDAAARAG